MGKFKAKIRNFDSFVGCIPTFCPDKREICHGGSEPSVHSPRDKFHVYRQRVAP